MDSVVGHLGDSHRLSVRARGYANDVIFGEEWPLTASLVDLDAVTFETSARMRRKHGVCSSTAAGTCTIRVAEKTFRRGGSEAFEETVRHELVHVYQCQDENATMGHGPSFGRWVDPLSLSGRCSEHYNVEADDYVYSFHCSTCGFIGGRYRMCETVRAGLADSLRCRRCGSMDVEVRDRRRSSSRETDRMRR